MPWPVSQVKKTSREERSAVSKKSLDKGSCTGWIGMSLREWKESKWR